MNDIVQRMLVEARKPPSTFSSSKFNLLLDSCARKVLERKRVTREKTQEEIERDEWVSKRMEEILNDKTIKISCDPQRAYYWALSDWERKQNE